jgi:sugar/nucleoside kinase (ribokinase family)
MFSVSAPDILVAGHLCLDLLPNMDSIPLNELATPGRLFESGPMHFSTGGAVSNTGLALHRLGVSVGLLANIGDDLIGRLTSAFLESRDPALTRYIHIRSGYPASYTIVLSPQRVDRIFLSYPGTNAGFTSADVDYSVVAQAKMFHLGYPPLLPRLIENDGEDLAALFQRVRDTGAITSLDFTLPDTSVAQGTQNWRSTLAKTLPFVDIFIPSVEEILFMLRRTDYDRWHGAVLRQISANYLDDLADEMLALGASAIVGFKLGELGMYLRTSGAARFARLSRLPIDAAAWANRTLWHPSFEVNVAGTTGAGDSAYAGFLSALLKGMSPDEAIRWACAVGACNVEAPDSTSGVQTWETTQRRLEAGWHTRALHLSGYSG